MLKSDENFLQKVINYVLNCEIALKIFKKKISKSFRTVLKDDSKPKSIEFHDDVDFKENLGFESRYWTKANIVITAIKK